MGGHPTNNNYIEWVSEWKIAERNSQEAGNKKLKEQFIKTRNSYADKVLSGMHFLIAKTVNKKIFNIEDQEEAINEAKMLVVSRAFILWDEEKAAENKASFLTYAMFWVNAAIATIRERANLVKIPKDKQSQAWRRVREGNVQEGDEEFNPVFIGWNNPCLNGESQNENIGEYIIHSRGLNPFEDTGDTLHTESMLSLLGEAIKSLPTEQMKNVIASRLNGDTLRSVGTKMGLSRERIRQVEVLAHSYMKDFFLRKAKPQEEAY